MVDNRQWQNDMIDSTNAVYVSKKCSYSEAELLRASVNKPINHLRMDDDTRQRTGGKCPVSRGYLQRQFTMLATAVEKLKQKWR